MTVKHISKGVVDINNDMKIIGRNPIGFRPILFLM